jgi:MFS family permease
MAESGGRLGKVAASYAGVVRSRSYFPLWLGQLLSSFGDTLHYIALVVLVFELTGRGLAVAGVVVAEVVPVLLLGPVAGVVIDRFSRKAVLIGADLARAALVLSLVWPQGAWHAYLVAAGLAAGNSFFNPAVQAVIPALTTEEQRLAANSVAWSTGRLVQIVASAVAGGLIALVGTGPAFALNAASFVASALLITALPIPPRAGAVGAGAKRGLARFLADARAGLAYAARDRLVSRLLVVQGLASFAVGATGALLVVLSERHLRLPPSGFAWLIGAIGAGALVGPLIPNALARDYRDARWLFVPYVVRGVGDALIAVFTPLPVALLILFVYGLNTSTGMVVYNSTIQGVVPDAVRGRVFTLLDVEWSALRLLSLALGGLLVDAVGIRPVYWMGGGLLALAGLLGLALLGGHDFQARQAASG